MRLLAATLLTIVATATTTISAQHESYPRGRVIGSVEIPALHAAINGDLPPGRPAALSLVALYIEPTEHTAVAAVVSDSSELTPLEHGYEQISAAVYEIRTLDDRVWYRVHYTTSRGYGDGWISNRETSTYHPLADMLVHGLAFLTDSWDRAVFDAPRANSDKRTIRATNERPNLRVVATAGDAEHLWLQVELLEGSVCEGVEQPAIATSGWIPAFSRDGQLTAWHYARGC